MALDLAPLVEKYETFFSTTYTEQINELSESYPEKRSLEVNYSDLDKFDYQLADDLLRDPDKHLKAAEEALKNMPTVLMQGQSFEPHARFWNLPPTAETLVQDVGAEQIGKLIAVDCMVTKRGERRPKVKIAFLRCKLCDSTYKIVLEKDTELPTVCDSCKRRALTQVEEESKFTDLQKAETQEPLERTRGGATASRIEVWVEDDLVNSFFPGQRVMLTGILRIRPPQAGKGKSSQGNVYGKYIEVIHVAKVEKEFEEVDISKQDRQKILELSKDPKVYDKLVQSVAPSIYGHDEVKQALALQLLGGTPDKETVDRGKIRDEIHVLLIGDPGAAKTRFLQYANRLAPKSVYVSGKSVSGAGLTAAAERDELSEGGWTLKAGALVLASGGLASVDEFDKISEEDRAAMHEVMESGSVSVAKAGIVAKFRANTSILAAANPKYGRFDPNMYPAQQFDIPPTILSRFDLIFPIRDVMDEEKDKKLADHILNQHWVAGIKSAKEDNDTGVEEVKPAVDMDLLRKYVAYAKRYVSPVLTAEANDKIKEYYVELRKVGAQAGSTPITPRQIEGLIRLSEASAKTRLSNRVELVDAARAINLMDFVLKSTMMDKSLGRIDIDIITTGAPKSKMDKLKTVLDIVRDLEKKYDMVKVDSVLEEADKYDISDRECREILGDLLRKTSDLYEPRHGYVKLVRRKVE